MSRSAPGRRTTVHYRTEVFYPTYCRETVYSAIQLLLFHQLIGVVLSQHHNWAGVLGLYRQVSDDEERVTTGGT